MSHASTLILSSISTLLVSYYIYHIYHPAARNLEKGGLFSLEDLRAFSGVDDRPLYLVILGEVFDVTKGRKHYEKGAAYNIFIGRDASRLFVTGAFSNLENADSVLDLSCQELASLNDWNKKYHKDYIFKGKLVGRFYNGKGDETSYKKLLNDKLSECDSEKLKNDEEYNKYPPCNVEWNPEVGTKVWCSKKSGGIERDWVGVPRLKYSVNADEKRCVCVNTEIPHEENLFKNYDGCDSDSNTCFVNN